MGKQSPPSPSWSFILDRESLAGQLSLVFLGIFATAIFAVFVYLIWSVLQKLRYLDCIDNQKLPYVKLESLNLSLIGEDLPQPKRNEREQSSGGYSSSFVLPWGSLSSREPSKIELASFESGWDVSPEYPQTAWN